MTTDWRRWHDHYDDATSSLSRRLAVVQQRLGEALGTGAVRSVLSLCAGDGRDVIPLLAAHPSRAALRATLVELDPVLAAAAERRAADAGIPVTVLVGDAGGPATWSGVPPVDLLLLCGIFGNVPLEDVQSTIEHTPRLLTPGGFVLWTRGANRDSDLRPQIREWFRLTGLREVSFDQEQDGYGVGMSRRSGEPAGQVAELPRRLFTFAT